MLITPAKEKGDSRLVNERSKMREREQVSKAQVEPSGEQ